MICKTCQIQHNATNHVCFFIYEGIKIKKIDTISICPLHLNSESICFTVAFGILMLQKTNVQKANANNMCQICRRNSERLNDFLTWKGVYEFYESFFGIKERDYGILVPLNDIQKNSKEFRKLYGTNH